FQAEDGIRDGHVTGVQTCALPISEMVNARKGVGYMVEAARKVLDFERVYAGIIAIGIAAFLFRFLLTFLEARLFPWRKVSRPASEPVAAAATGAPTKVHAHADSN